MRLNGLHKAPLAGAFFITWLLLTVSGVSADPVKKVEVRQVVDGDSLVLANGQQVRLIGINTPEMSGADDRPEPLAKQARDTLEYLIGSQPVRLVPGEEKRDRHRRLLAHVETVDGRDVQERLLTEGLAFLVAIPPNIARLNRYSNAQDIARRARRGVWRDPAFQPIAASDLPATDPLGRFKQVRGTVIKYNASKRYYYFRMSGGFEFKVPRDYWVYFDGQPGGLVGKEMTVRGWVTKGKYRLQMRVSHPAMMDLH